MHARLAFAAFVAALLPALSACDLFGVVRCDVDDDCPGSLPFCVSGVCSEEDDDDGRGRGIDEGCDTDADCPKGLCYDLTEAAAHFEAARVGACVPAEEDDASCAEASFLGGTAGVDRDSGGPIIFGASAQRAGGGGSCTPGTQFLSLDVLYLDREGDWDPSSTAMLVAPPGAISPSFASGSVSGDGTSGQGFFFMGECVPDTASYVAIRMGSANDEAFTSNSLCVPIAAAP
jgi:hypothetical protein